MADLQVLRGSVAEDHGGSDEVRPVPLTVPPNAVRLRPAPTPVNARAEYVAQYATACAGVWVAAVWVTPTDAANWLANNNGRNRPLSSAYRKLIEKIAGGMWRFNAETLIFGSDGHILNGQHRLTAIAAGNEPVPMLVVYGISPDVFSTYDQAKRRSAADVLAIEDYTNCTTLATALTWAQRHSAGEMSATVWTAIPNEAVTQVAAKYPDLPVSAALVKGKYVRCKHIPPGLLAFLHSQFSKLDQRATEDFFERIVEKVGIQKPSWEHLLLRRLEGDLSGKRTITEQVEIAALVIKCWNNIRLNRQPGEILTWKRSQNEPFPAIV